MCQFLINLRSGILSNLPADLLTAIITVVIIAWVKKERLKKELNELSRILGTIYTTRTENKSGQEQEKAFDDLRRQINETLEEVINTKEGIFGISFDVKEKLRSLKQEVDELLNGRLAADFMKTLFGDSNIAENEFITKVRHVSEMANEIAKNVGVDSVLFP